MKFSTAPYSLIKLVREIMYEISTHFLEYLPIATSPQTTQTASAAISIAATGKKPKIESFIDNITVIKNFQLLEMLCVVATLFTFILF